MRLPGVVALISIWPPLAPPVPQASASPAPVVPFRQTDADKVLPTLPSAAPPGFDPRISAGHDFSSLLAWRRLARNPPVNFQGGRETSLTKSRDCDRNRPTVGGNAFVFACATRSVRLSWLERKAAPSWRRSLGNSAPRSRWLGLYWGVRAGGLCTCRLDVEKITSQLAPRDGEGPGWWGGPATVSGVGRLDPDLMFSTGLQPEPQFGDAAFVAGERILRNDFVMRDGLADFGVRIFELRFRKHVLAQFVPAQLQPLPPGAGGRDRTTFHERHILPLHGVRLQLLDEVVARGGVRSNAKNAAGKLVESMNRQQLQPAIDGRQ